MKIPILASFTGKIIAITTGLIAAGSNLFTTECMKMDCHQNSPTQGTFEAVVVVGALVLAGETIIGYFTPHDE